MTPDKSSNIAAVDYDAHTQTLKVQFKNGGAFNYAGVTKERYDALVSADSVGKHFHRHIRNAHRGTPA